MLPDYITSDYVNRLRAMKLPRILVGGITFVEIERIAEDSGVPYHLDEATVTDSQEIPTPEDAIFDGAILSTILEEHLSILYFEFLLAGIDKKHIIPSENSLLIILYPASHENQLTLASWEEKSFVVSASLAELIDCIDQYSDALLDAEYADENEGYVAAMNVAAYYGQILVRVLRNLDNRIPM